MRRVRLSSDTLFSYRNRNGSCANRMRIATSQENCPRRWEKKEGGTYGGRKNLIDSAPLCYTPPGSRSHLSLIPPLVGPRNTSTGPCVEGRLWKTID